MVTAVAAGETEPSEENHFEKGKKMNLHEVSAARGEREDAQGPLRKSTDAGIELIRHPEDEEGQFKE